MNHRLTADVECLQHSCFLKGCKNTTHLVNFWAICPCFWSQYKGVGGVLEPPSAPFSAETITLSSFVALGLGSKM